MNSGIVIDIQDEVARRIEEDIVKSEIMKSRDNVKIAESGLVEDGVWRGDLKGYDTELVEKIRQSLLKEVTGLVEKYNNGPIKYFGYRRKDAKDSVYIYIQKSGIRIDLNLPRDFEIDLERAGFTIKHQDNFQGQAEWLTGWHISHEWQKIGEVIKWLRLALGRN